MTGRRAYLICILLLSCILVVSAQQQNVVEYRGRVVEADGHEPIGSAIILLLLEREGVEGKVERVGFGNTDSDGRYRIRLSQKQRPTLLEVRLMGYKTQRIRLDDTTQEPTIYLEADSQELPEVVVVGTPITASGDTVTYRAAAFITRDTYSAEDLMKRLPGITVDARGIISYLGDPIQGVYIEGLDLVADSYQTATRIVKAEDISAVDVMERFQKKKVLRGVEEGHGTMLNIRLKDNRMLTPSGEATVGAGVLDEKDLVYSLGVDLLLVNKQTQILGAAQWDTTTGQESDLMGLKRRIPSSSARSFGGSTLSSHAVKSQAQSQTDGLATLNQLFVLRDDVTAKYNLGYGYKSTSARRVKESLLAGNDQEFLHFKEEHSSDIASHLARLQFNYTENSSQRYLLNTFTIEGDWEWGGHHLFRDEAIEEEVRGKEYRVANDFSLVARRGNNSSKLEGKVEYRKLPLLMSAVPSGRYAYRQEIYGSDLSTFTRAGYGWGLDRFYSIWGVVELEGQWQDIGLATESDERRSVRGGRVLVSTTPTLSYTAARLKWSIGVPFQVNYLAYQFQDEAFRLQQVRRAKVSPGLSARWSYRPSGISLGAGGSLGIMYRR